MIYLSAQGAYWNEYGTSKSPAASQKKIVLLPNWVILVILQLKSTQMLGIRQMI